MKSADKRERPASPGTFLELSLLFPPHRRHGGGGGEGGGHAKGC